MTITKGLLLSFVLITLGWIYVTKGYTGLVIYNFSKAFEWETLGLSLLIAVPVVIGLTSFVALFYVKLTRVALWLNALLWGAHAVKEVLEGPDMVPSTVAVVIVLIASVGCLGYLLWTRKRRSQ
ncbi:MAG: hypothetical protein GY801_48970 [bacterium]|nr:hypothetical protein [bacterium]